MTPEAAIIEKWDTEHNNNFLVNQVILLSNRLLYVNRTTSAKLNLYSLKIFPRYTENIVKCKAKEKGSLESHSKKLTSILHLLKDSI